MAEVEQLLRGYRRFYKQHFLDQEATLPALARDGQSPTALVIACSDSRVDPAIITDAAPGEIFAIRNVANLVPPYQPDNETYHGTSAAVEFAIQNLGIKHIIVLGHSGCAGIDALLNSTDETPAKGSFVLPWVNIARKAKDYVLNLLGSPQHPDANATCEQQAVLVSLQNLMTFPWIEEKVNHGQLKLHGWYFRIATGRLHTWDHVTDSFVRQPVDGE